MWGWGWVSAPLALCVWELQPSPRRLPSLCAEERARRVHAQAGLLSRQRTPPPRCIASGLDLDAPPRLDRSFASRPGGDAPSWPGARDSVPKPRRLIDPAGSDTSRSTQAARLTRSRPPATAGADPRPCPGPGIDAVRRAPNGRRRSLAFASSESTGSPQRAGRSSPRWSQRSVGSAAGPPTSWPWAPPAAPPAGRPTTRCRDVPFACVCLFALLLLLASALLPFYGVRVVRLGPWTFPPRPPR